MFKSQKLKKWTSLLVAIVTTFAVFSQGLSITARAATSKTFDLLEITDFHGTLLDSQNNQVGAVLSNRVKTIEAANPNDTLVIGGGDLYQGTAISNMAYGVPVQKVMSDLGMEVTALGNHEFDWGLDTITSKTMVGAKYSIVCANLYDKTTGKRVFDPYKIISKDGVRIAVIGAITQDTPNIVTPKMVQNYEFTDIATEINAAAKQIRDAHAADVVLAVIHEGQPVLDTITSKLVGVDAVFGGHDHYYAAKTVNGIPEVNAGAYGKGYIDLKMTVTSDGKISFPDASSNSTTMTAAVYHPLNNVNGYLAANPVVDPTAKSIIDAANADVVQITSEVIGQNTNSQNELTSTQIVNGAGTGTYGESYLGNWMADAIRSSASADVGMTNNGGIRLSQVPNGDITVGTMWSMMPFDDIIYKVPMTKAQLKSILEDAVKDGGKGIQISGIKFSYDMTKPSGNRVFNITREDGKPISSSEILQVAAPDFVATGGDGFGSFINADGANPANNTGVLVRDALIANVKANKDKDPSIVTTMDNRITQAAQPAASSITILATSDVHGNIYPEDYYAGKPANQGLAKVSSYVNSVRDANQNVMLIDDGDSIQGTPLVYYYDKIDTTSLYPMMAVMGAMGYDAWTLGNHEFNFGLPTLNRVIADAGKENIPVLSANTYKTDNTNFVKPYIIKTYSVNGKTVKVGIIGLTTKCIPNWEDPSHYAGLHFNDLVDEAKKWVPIVKQAGADIVVVSAHSGEEGKADVIPENEVKAIATQVSGIDAIVAGHVHNVVDDLTLKNPEGKVVPVVEPGKYGQYVSQITFNYNQDGTFSIATKNVKMDDSIAADPYITNVIAKPYEDATQNYIQTKIGTSIAEYTGAGQYVQPTAIMDLVNKVQQQAAGTQLSIAAPLSATADIPKGDITIKDIMGVYVYENYLYGIKMTGAQLKDWMEYSVRYYKQINDPNFKITSSTDYKTLKDMTLNVPDYNLDQLYGATYDIDLTQPACQTDKTGRVIESTEHRIKNLKINGVPVDPDKVYTVAINDYRYNGGGGFMAAAGLSNTNSSIVTYSSARALGDDGQVRSLMMKYIQNNKTITPTNSSSWKIYTIPVSEGANVISTGSLPNTGSNVDSNMVVELGFIFLAVGAAFIVVERRKRKNTAA